MKMRATGIVRRIDDLGRVVIPKEIRRTMKIREGDPLEVFIQGDVVCFKKYDDGIADNLRAIADGLEEDCHYDLADAIRKVATEYDKKQNGE
jgi:AbrB family transcriptional regulator (stage V sporulation protein T)